MEPRELAIRQETYRLFVQYGRAPTRGEVAAALGETLSAVDAGWRSLHEQHAVVLDRAGELRMANPFSAVETPYRVHVAGRSWFANCAWDAFGICAALHSDGVIETACPDCAEALTIEVADKLPDHPQLRFHCLVPASRWWEDIVFT